MENKKIYIQPLMEIVELQNSTVLLSGSVISVTNSTLDADNALSPEITDWELENMVICE